MVESMNSNVIFSGFNGGLNNVVTELIIRFSFKNTYLISTDKPKVISRDNYFNWNEVKYSSLYKKINWENIIPISNELLNQSKILESQFYSMYMRIDPYISYRKLSNLFKLHLRFWNDFILNNKVNLFISSNIPHEGFDYLIYGILKIYGITTIMLYSMPVVPGKVNTINYLFDLHNPIESLESEYELIKLQDQIYDISDLREDFKSYFEVFSQSNYIPFTRAELTNSFIFKKINQFFTSPKSFFRGIQKIKAHYNVNYFFLLLILIRDFIEMSILDFQKFRLSNYYRKNCTDPDFLIEYLFFPLNYQPEASTNPLAGNYTDLLLIAEEVSFFLPENYLLLIKEHPRISSLRTKDFYKKLLKIKNIRFIDVNYDTHKLILNSKAVVTTTGTVGIESIINHIPVIMFGSRVYQYLNGIFKINKQEDIVKFIDYLIGNKIHVDSNLTIKFFKLLENYSTQATNYLPDLQRASISLEENNILLTELLSKAINKKI